MAQDNNSHVKLFYVLSIFTILFLTMAGFIGGFLYLKKEVKSLYKTVKRNKLFYKNIKKGVKTSMPLLGRVTIPSYIQNIPLANNTGLVVSSKKVKIRGVDAPYNASIIKKAGSQNYLLFFRYDVMDDRSVHGYFTYIGCAELDKNFNQTEDEFKIIDTSSSYSEDPRVVFIGDELFLTYNDFMQDNKKGRAIYIANLDKKSLKVKYKTNLDMHLQPIEKNWIPFEYVGKNGKPTLHFEYYLNPHKIIKLDDPSVNNITHLTFPNISTYQHLYWPYEWGVLRGGTSVKKVDGKYLGFFHSSFIVENKFSWYIMGAYTFDSKPPFNMTSISHYPILFDGIYDSPIMNTASPSKRVIFPCGFVVENRDGRDLIHISCGENDCAVKIVTLDKEKLFASMKKLKPKSNKNGERL